MSSRLLNNYGEYFNQTFKFHLKKFKKFQQTCSGQQNPTKIERCIDINPAYPYCHQSENRCSPFAGNCIMNTNNFICPSEGYFPNIENCYKFYYCTGQRQKSQSFKCKDDYIYNSKTKNCISTHLQPNCLFIDCKNNYQNSFMSYQPDPSYFVVCNAVNGLLIGRINKCPDGQIFNVRKERCEFEQPMKNNK